MFNYPPGYIPSAVVKKVDMACPKCGHEWESTVIQELGGTWFADEDFGDICPECGWKGK